MRPARILVLRGGALGDFIVTFPAFAALRSRWPDGYIELVAYPHLAPLAHHAGLVNHVRSLNDGALARYFAPDAPIRDEDQAYFASFDFIVNFIHDPGKHLADNLKRCGVQVLLSASPMVENGHAVDHFLRPLESLAIYDPDRVPAIPSGASVEKSADRRVTIHPGSGSRSKNWSLPRFLEIADRLKRLGYEVEFLTGDAEREYIPNLDALLASHIRHHNLPLAEIAGRIGRNHLYIGNDSGISHLAAATGCDTLVLFGPSDERQWSPRGKSVVVLKSPDSCMDGLDTEFVWAEVLKMLEPPEVPRS